MIAGSTKVRSPEVIRLHLIEADLHPKGLRAMFKGAQEPAFGLMVQVGFVWCAQRFVRPGDDGQFSRLGREGYARLGLTVTLDNWSHERVEAAEQSLKVLRACVLRRQALCISFRKKAPFACARLPPCISHSGVICRAFASSRIFLCPCCALFLGFRWWLAKGLTLRPVELA